MNRMLLMGAVLSLGVAASARGAGLLAPDDRTLPPLRVTGHLVDVQIRDQVALTTLTQTFHNDTRSRLEATYVFPLPEQADLTNFQMTFNGKMVEGEVLPAEEARRVYESIVRQSRDPGLIEFIGRRLLRMRVFPIEPGSDTVIKVSYQQVTRPIGGMQGYHYPLHTTQAAGQVHGTVRFSIDLDTQAPLKSIWSPTHSVEVVRKGEKSARIDYEASGGSLSDDFILLYDTDGSDVGLSLVAHKPGTEPGFFVLVLSPRQLWPEASRQPQDVAFVVDTSGSMAGEKMAQVRSALQFCIDQLDERDRFEVVRFSTGFDLLFGALSQATAENRARARQFAAGFAAAGGTNIDDALVAALKLRSTGEQAAPRPFVVVFLTDGQGNRKPEETLRAVAAAPGARDSLRIFPFGVGHDVNTILLDRLAADYRGKPSYVQPGENLELVLGDFFSVVSQPVLTGLSLSLPGVGATEQFPPVLGELYRGQQIIIAGRFAGAATGAVKLTAMRDGTPVEFTWPDVAFQSAPDATYVPAVWAGRKIAYLIDEIRAHGESQEMVQEIVALSRQYGIQTPYTSWLVAPERYNVVLGAGLGGEWRHRPQLPPGVRRDAPGPGGGSGGGGGMGPRPGAPRRPAPGKGGDTFHGIPADEAERAVTKPDGSVATRIAAANAALRDAVSRDGQRLDPAVLPVRRLGDRWYHWIDGILVDQDVDEHTQVTIVKFGTDAYFELAEARPGLRAALAAGSSVMVLTGPGRAVLVSETGGIEQFSAAEREQNGLPGRLNE
jgi:Ca-activated chloride channel family protein